MRQNGPIRLLLALTLVLGLLLGLGSAAYATPRSHFYELPGSDHYPEGIAFDQSTGYVYVSTTTDNVNFSSTTTNGAIYRFHVKDETASLFLPGNTDGRTFVAGLEVDNSGRLFLSGGPTGKMFVYDTSSGTQLASFTSSRIGAGEPTFVNDVAVTKSGEAFFTDSLYPVLYRVYTNAQGALAMEEWLSFNGTALAYSTGFNVNGIEATPDGKYLILVQSNTGELFRVSLDTKEVVQIDLDNTTVTAGDGLVLRGHTLYVVRNQFALIAEVRLTGDYTSGQLVGETTDDSFAFPTTAVQARGQLLVVNSQFNKRNTGDPVIPFTVSSVSMP